MNAATADQSIAPDAPRYFVESLKFPYIEGLKLVVQAYRRSGWKEIDRMHANPPRTTREIIHSAEYFARLDGGGPLPATGDLRPATDSISVEHLGEFHWRFLVGDHATGWINARVTIGCDGIVA